MAGSLMLDHLGEKHGEAKLVDAALMIEQAVDSGLADNLLHPMEYGGDRGTRALTRALIDRISGTL